MALHEQTKAGSGEGASPRPQGRHEKARLCEAGKGLRPDAIHVEGAALVVRLAAGALDAGDFMLKLREDRAEDEWIDEYWKTKNTSQGYAEYMRAPQPAHRCLSHLILLIVRTVESSSGVDGELEDLQITKKELKEYSQNVQDGMAGGSAAHRVGVAR